MVAMVDPEYIKDQRVKGWPDVHPEDYCHLCGGENIAWHIDREQWLVATAQWSAETGREGICCPICFVAMFKTATGKDPIWELRIHVQ